MMSYVSVLYNCVIVLWSVWNYAFIYQSNLPGYVPMDRVSLDEVHLNLIYQNYFKNMLIPTHSKNYDFPRCIFCLHFLSFVPVYFPFLSSSILQLCLHFSLFFFSLPSASTYSFQFRDAGYSSWNLPSCYIFGLPLLWLFSKTLLLLVRVSRAFFQSCFIILLWSFAGTRFKTRRSASV